MHVRADSFDEEVRLTVDAAMELANVVLDEPDDVAGELRTVLLEHDFLRAKTATADQMAAFADRCVPLARLMATLPEATLPEAV